MFSPETACVTVRLPLFAAFIVFFLLLNQGTGQNTLGILSFYPLLFSIILNLHSLLPRQQLFSRGQHRNTETSAKPSSEFEFKCLANFVFLSFPPETISHKIIDLLLYCHFFLNLTNCT